MRKRRLGRFLVVLGVCLWIPELWYAWIIGSSLLMHIKGPHGERVIVQVHLNWTAWLAVVGWTLYCWGLVGLGLWLIKKSPAK